MFIFYVVFCFVVLLLWLLNPIGLKTGIRRSTNQERCIGKWHRCKGATRRIHSHKEAWSQGYTVTLADFTTSCLRSLYCLCCHYTVCYKVLYSFTTTSLLESLKIQSHFSHAYVQTMYMVMGVFMCTSWLSLHVDRTG